jgi:hypothetical protein
VDVEPGEIPALQKAAEGLARARRAGDGLPAECTPETKSAFADALKELRDAKRDAQDARLEVTRQFDQAKSRIKVYVDELTSSVAAAYESISDRFLALEAAERRRREEEAAAAERRRREEQEAENAKAREEDRRARHIPAPPPRKEPTGARGASGIKAAPRKELRYRIVDEEKIPDEYWKRELNRAKLQADNRAGIAIPGVEPYYDERVQVG